MMPHPTTMHAVADLRRAELHATAAQERNAQIATGPAPQWRPVVVRLLAFVIVALGLRG